VWNPGLSCIPAAPTAYSADGTTPARDGRRISRTTAHSRQSLNTALVDQLDEDLRPLIEANPDQGKIILQELTSSDDADDRDTAAIYVQYLFRAHPVAAQDIWVKLARDPDRAVRDQARECASEILPELLFSSDAEMQRHALTTIDAIVTPY
jgi:hypothetical protein